MKTIAIIQARMRSSRLPGKVLKMLKGRSVLRHVVERVSACSAVDEVVVATTDQDHDRCITTECNSMGVNCFTGSEDDVLDRYYQAARYHDAELVIRVTSDCPLFSPTVLSSMLQTFFKLAKEDNSPDYLSNTVKRTFPRGLDAEIITISALTRTWREASQPYEREHVTPYIYQHPEFFKLAAYETPQNYAWMRWTLDTPEDWCFIKQVFDCCETGNEIFSSEDIIDLLARKPHLQEINAAVCQKSLTG